MHKCKNCIYVRSEFSDFLLGWVRWNYAKCYHPQSIEWGKRIGKTETFQAHLGKKDKEKKIYDVSMYVDMCRRGFCEVEGKHFHPRTTFQKFLRYFGM